MGRREGFSLLELLLSVSIIGILSALSIPVYLGMQKKNDLDVAVVTVAQGLRRAAARAVGVDADTGWGVKVQSGSSTIFKGTTFSSRDTSLDEVSQISTAIAVSGTSEFDFVKFTGTPSAVGTLTLATSDDTATISVNVKGTVSY